MIFVLVYVSRDFEFGTNVSCEESTVSLCTVLIFVFLCLCKTTAFVRPFVHCPDRSCYYEIS